MAVVELLLSEVRRLARTRTLVVEGVAFEVRATWGVMREFTRRLAEIEAAEMGERARDLAVEEAAREMLARVVVGWDGTEAWSPERLDELDAATVAELLRRVGERPEELGPGNPFGEAQGPRGEWLALVRAYVQGRPIAEAPLPMVLDALLTRYPGYTAAELLEEDHHVVQALLDITCAANDEANRSWQR